MLAERTGQDLRERAVVAREAALMGFDEIQFDDLRVPSDGPLGAIRYSMPNSQEARLNVVSAFLRRARTDVGSLGASMAVDIVGYAAFNPNDTGVGQRLEELAPLVDCSVRGAMLLPVVACRPGWRGAAL